MKFIFCLVLSITTLLNCQNTKQSNNEKQTASDQKFLTTSQCIPTKTFNRKDTVGIFKGPVVHFSDTSAGSASGGIMIKDQAGDSISFLFSYGESKNIDVKKLSLGSCIEINFHAKVFLEEGIEINRLFFIDDIKYQ